MGLKQTVKAVQEGRKRATPETPVGEREALERGGRRGWVVPQVHQAAALGLGYGRAGGEAGGGEQARGSQRRVTAHGADAAGQPHVGSGACLRRAHGKQLRCRPWDGSELGFGRRECGD